MFGVFSSSPASVLGNPAELRRVLAEIAALITTKHALGTPHSVPFFDNRGPRSEFRRIGL